MPSCCPWYSQVSQNCLLLKWQGDVLPFFLKDIWRSCIINGKHFSLCHPLAIRGSRTAQIQFVTEDC